MRCPDTAVFRPSPPLVARSLTRLPIYSGKSHPGLWYENLVRPPVHRPVIERLLLLPQFAVGRMQYRIVDNELTLHGMSTEADPESDGITFV